MKANIIVAKFLRRMGVDRNKAEAIKKWFTRWWTYFNTGMSQLNTIKYLTMMVGGVGGLTGYFSVWQVFLIAVGFLVLSLIFGWLWDALELFHHQAEFSNERNWLSIEIRDMEKRIMRIEEEVCKK